LTWRTANIELTACHTGSNASKTLMHMLPSAIRASMRVLSTQSRLVSAGL
jgi:hypothetical protein